MDLQHPRLMTHVLATPGSRRPAPAGGTDEYLTRVEQTLGHWFLLTGQADGTALFRRLGSGLDPLPHPGTWRRHSRLCADGAPVELCHRLGDDGGPAYTMDCGPYGASPPARRAHALRTAAAVAAERGADPTMPATLRAEGVPPGSAVWLGVAHPVAGGARLKLYLASGARDARAGERAALDLLGELGRPPGRAGHSLLGRLRDPGHFRQIGLAVDGSGPAKLYYRLRSVDLPLLTRLAEEAELPVEPFAAYVRRLLGARDTWRDPEAGIGVGLDAAGDLAEIALYHYARFYFRDDAALRRHVIEASRAFRWDVHTFRAATRLLTPPRRTMGLLGFGARGGACGLRVYQSTGSLARHPNAPQKEAS